MLCEPAAGAPDLLGGAIGPGLACTGVRVWGDGFWLATDPEEAAELSCCDGWRARMGVGAFGNAGVATGIFGEA